MDKQLVVKSNFLVEASYRLSAVEQKIILTLATKIKQTDKEFKKYLFNLRDLGHFLGLKSNADYDYLRKTTQNLLSKVLVLQKEDSILQTHWLESVEYFDSKSTVSLCFNPELKPFLIQLKNNFTKFQLKYAIQLKSRFSIRIYELLKQYENIGNRIFTLSELRERLGVQPEEYPLYGNFKAKVLKVAQKELKAKTDLFFKFEEVKTGRKVTDIKFVITAKNFPTTASDEEMAEIRFAQAQLFTDEPGDSEEAMSLKKLKLLLPAEYQNQKSIEKILLEYLQKSDFDRVARNIEYANDNSNATNPGANLTKGSNYRNYLAKSLKADFGLAYQEDKSSVQKKAQKEKQLADDQKKKKQLEFEQINQQREMAFKAKEYVNSLSPEEKMKIENEAVLTLDANTQDMVKNNRSVSRFIISRAMEKLVIDKYLTE